jgi:hypothetical protein
MAEAPLTNRPVVHAFAGNRPVLACSRVCLTELMAAVSCAFGDARLSRSGTIYNYMCTGQRGNMRRIGLKMCPYCRSSEVYVSGPKTFWERIPAMFLLRLVRCHNCMRRHYRSPLLSAKHSPAGTIPTKPAPRHVRQRYCRQT